MVKRVWFVGANEQTAPQIEESFREGLEQLEAHLRNRRKCRYLETSFAERMLLHGAFSSGMNVV
jgi:hypothetical protein